MAKGLTQTGEQEVEGAYDPTDPLKGHYAANKGLTGADLEDAYTLSKTTGIGKAGWLRKRLLRMGVQFDEDGNIVDGGGDIDTDNIDYTDIAKAGKLIRGKGRESLQRKKFDLYLADTARRKTQEFYDENLEPTYEKVEERINEMLDNPAVSAEEIGLVRSDMAAQVRAQEAQRLRRVGATLGLSGMDPSSVTGGAIVNQVVEESDRALTDALRKFGLDVFEIERQSEAAELGLASGLNTQRFAAQAARDSGNLETVLGLSNDIGSLLEALEALEAADDNQISGSQKLLKGGLTAVGTAVGAYFGGPAGAQAGGAAGTAIGDAVVD